MVVRRRKMWNHYSTCNDDDFLGPLCRNCQFCILSRYHRTHYKSQTPTASHPCPPGLELQCSPGGWCPLVRSPLCVGNNTGTGHLRQTTVASSSSNFRPKIVFIINWCYKKHNFEKLLSFIFLTHLFHQPSLSLRGEKSVHQVIVGFVRNFERFLLDVSEDRVQHVRWEIFSRVNSSVLLDELFWRDLHLGVGVVESSVEHDDGEGEDEAGVSLLKYVRVLLAVVGSEAVHDSVNLHGLSWQSIRERKILKVCTFFYFLIYLVWSVCGYLKLHKNWRRAWTKSRCENWWHWTKYFSTCLLKSSWLPKYFPAKQTRFL